MTTGLEPQYFCEYPRWSETLGDQSRVLIRPIRKQDKVAERAFIDGLSTDTRRLRFLGQSHPSDRMVEQLTNIDYVHDMALVAVSIEDAREKIVGVSRYNADKDEINCECAVTVSDDWQQRGLGAVLMKHLIDVARRRGIRRMFSINSAQDMHMKELARHFGFHTRSDPGDHRQVLHELDLQVLANPGNDVVSN